MAGEGASNGGASSEEMRRATLFSRNGTVNTQCLQEVTGNSGVLNIKFMCNKKTGINYDKTKVNKYLM